MRAFFMVSQALMPKRCNVLLETVKELPPLQVLEKKVKDYAMTVRLKRETLWDRACSYRAIRLSVPACDIGATVRQ
ncbi:hypothetical protein EMIT0P100_20476 [Pseudomonas sp. IT-P100]